MLSVAQICALMLSGYMNGQTGLFYVISCGTSAVYAFWMLYTVDLDHPGSCWKWFVRSKYAGLLVGLGALVDWAVRLWWI